MPDMGMSSAILPSYPRYAFVRKSNKMSDPNAFIVARLTNRKAALISDPWAKRGTLKQLSPPLFG
jgi:hypothetical protein